MVSLLCFFCIAAVKGQEATSCGAPEAILCIRESPETCRGIPTKLVDVSNETSWGLNTVSWQTSQGGNGIVLSAFGDTDGDGDVDMVALVCLQKIERTGQNNLCNADLKFYENIAGAVPGTPPLWKERDANFITGNLSGIVPPGFVPYNPNVIGNFEGNVTYSGFEFNYMFPATLVLIDLDADDDLDLVLSLSEFGFSANSGSYYYQNIGNSSRAEWVDSASPIGSSPNDFPSDTPWLESVRNVFVHPDPLGDVGSLSFADLDADGDVDAVCSTSDSGTFYYENTGTKPSPSYTARGFIYKSPGDTSVVLHDLDNDGDYDVLIGSGRGDANVYVIENTGSRFEPAWTKKKSYNWIGLDKVIGPLNNFGIHLQQIIDLDLDGLDDFVYQSSGPNYSPLEYGKMKFFRRIKVVGPGNFMARTTWELSDTKFDTYFQDSPKPVGIDLNGDNLTDLIVGYRKDGVVLNIETAEYYENKGIGKDGVNYADSKELKDKDGNVIIEQMLRSMFLDIDQDNDFDLILGTYKDGLLLYKNIGTSTVPSFERQIEWSLDHVCEKEVPDEFGEFDFNCGAAVGNFDEDSLLDIIVFNNGQQMYKHLLPTTETSPKFVRETEWEGSSDLPNGLPSIEAIGGITFGDVDQDGDDDAVVGKPDGTLEYYERIELSPPKWKKTENAAWSLSDINVGTAPKPTLLDYDNDGDLDLIVGNRAGKLLLFEQATCATSCTTTGQCNIATEYMPTCTCSFAGGTTGRSCNSCDSGYYFVPSDSTGDRSVDGSDAGTCRACDPGKYGKFNEHRKVQNAEGNPPFGPTCLECPIGWAQPAQGKNECVMCGPTNPEYDPRKGSSTGKAGKPNCGK